MAWRATGGLHEGLLRDDDDVDRVRPEESWRRECAEAAAAPKPNSLKGGDEEEEEEKADDPVSY